MSSGSRIILLVTILVVAALATGLYLARVPEASTPPEDLLRRAETLHRNLVGDAAADPIRLKMIRDDYRGAATSTDPRVAAAALYGAGQVSILLGDTTSAITEWERIVSLRVDDFERLRVMKTLGDLGEAAGDIAVSQEWYGRIVAEYGDSDLPPGSAMLVAAARRRIE